MLTDEQKKLVEKNHNLIYGLADKMNLSIDEYYDILSIGLCKAAMSFDKNKGEFSTFAYSCMANEVKAYWRTFQKKSVIPAEEIVYYDAATVDEDSGNKTSLSEKIPDYSMQELAMYDIMSEEFIEGLTDIEKFVVSMLLEGAKHEDIAGVIGCQRQAVTYQIKRIREKAYRYLGYK